MSAAPAPCESTSTHPNPLHLATVDGERVASETPSDQRLFRFTVAKTAETSRWIKERESNLDQLGSMCVHVEREMKDGDCFIPATLLGARRSLSDVKDVHALVYDIDGAMPLDDVSACLDKCEHASFLYTTFSHRGTRTHIRTDKFEAWANKRKLPTSTAPTVEWMLQYVAEYKPHLTNVRYDDCFGWEQVQGLGNCYFVEHDPVDKCRVLVPLDAPIAYGKLDPNNKECNRKYRAIYFGVAESMGLGAVIDPACADPTHLFYEASCPKAMKPYAKSYAYAGPLLDWQTVAPSQREARRETRDTDASPRKDDRPHAVNGLNLKAWAAQYGKTFDIEKLMEARGLVVQPRDGGGVFCECHQEDAHTSANPPRTWAVNGDGEKGFVLYCHGAGGEGVACKEIDRLDKLRAYIEAEMFTVEDLQNEEFGGGKVSARAHREASRHKRSGTTVVDKNGKGLDCAVFHASMIAKPGLLDFGKLTGVTAETTPEQLAELIASGKLTVDDLAAAAIVEAPKRDDYEMALHALAARKVKDKLSERNTEIALKKLAKDHDVTLKMLREDFKEALLAEKFGTETEVPGAVDAMTVALGASALDYIDRYAIVNTGGRGVVMDLQQPDLAKAIMSEDSFELLHRHEWFDILTPDGPVTIFPAKEFLAKPPRGVQVYENGLVFEPSGIVGPGEYNLFQGFLVEPDPSGECSLLYELIRDVWCPGDPIAAEWVKEYFMHIFAHPAEKVRTAIAIRGGYGDGKSFIAEQLLSTILGDMILRVANAKLVTGDFNEAVAAKLLNVLEEAAFAGDKAAFDRLKELITGKTIMINGKFKAPFRLNNYARLLMVSNHLHFLFLKAKDRRYTSLESTDAWNGTDKFTRLLHQWNNGGAERFLYEAMNHKFRRFDDGQQLVINTNLKTEAGVQQVAHSRSALEKCVINLLLCGNFESMRTGQPILMDEDGGAVLMDMEDIGDRFDATPFDGLRKTLDGDAQAKLDAAIGAVRKQQVAVYRKVWPLDAELELPARTLELAVTEWVREHSREAAFINMNSIIATFEEILGPENVKKVRPKGRDDHRRVQLPTIRKFPRRQDAIIAAYRRGMLTRVEFEAVLDDGLLPPVRDVDVAQDDEKGEAA